MYHGGLMSRTVHILHIQSFLPKDKLLTWSYNIDSEITSVNIEQWGTSILYKYTYRILP